jgi:hypothetical protein
MTWLPHTWTVGRTRYIHLGFAIHKVIGKFNKPMEQVSRIYDTANEAIKAADDLQAAENNVTQYRAFRIARSSSGQDEPNTMVKSGDLPIHVSLNQPEQGPKGRRKIG